MTARARLAIDYIESSAEFGDARVYRYVLRRRWSEGQLALWILHNPSTADEHVLDPTLRRVEGFTRRLNLGGFLVCNLWPFRATDPGDCHRHRHSHETISLNDDHWIHECVLAARIVIVGWGKTYGTARPMQLIRNLGDTELFCLGMNIDGSPKHPLYLEKETRFMSFPGGVLL